MHIYVCRGSTVNTTQACINTSFVRCGDGGSDDDVCVCGKRQEQRGDCKSLKAKEEAPHSVSTRAVWNHLVLPRSLKYHVSHIPFLFSSLLPPFTKRLCRGSQGCFAMDSSNSPLSANACRCTLSLSFFLGRLFLWLMAQVRD